MLLRRELRIAGLDPNSGYFFNAVSCYPHRSPTDEEVLACKPNLVAQWRAIPAKYVLVCGRVALNTLMPKANRHTRGKVIHIHEKTIFPVYHPSYILRNPPSGPKWQRELEKFANLLRGFPPSNKACLYCERLPNRQGLYCSTHRANWVYDAKWRMPAPQQQTLL